MPIFTSSKMQSIQSYIVNCFAWNPGNSSCRTCKTFRTILPLDYTSKFRILHRIPSVTIAIFRIIFFPGVSFPTTPVGLPSSKEDTSRGNNTYYRLPVDRIVSQFYIIHMHRSELLLLLLLQHPWKTTWQKNHPLILEQFPVFWPKHKPDDDASNQPHAMNYKAHGLVMVRWCLIWCALGWAFNRLL